MDLYDLVQNLTNGAVEMLFRYAYAVPEDKREWRPAPDATTVMEILRENAILPLMLAEVLRKRPQQVDESVWEEAQREAGDLSTIDGCERACRTSTVQMLQALREVPADQWQQTVMLPWGMTSNLLQAALVHYWNLTYHLGQIAYIQRLYGDTNFH